MADAVRADVVIDQQGHVALAGVGVGARPRLHAASASAITASLVIARS